jgi:hypothetical protein
MKRIFTELWRELSADRWELSLAFLHISLVRLVIHHPFIGFSFEFL